jgi:hypothetical protein
MMVSFGSVVMAPQRNPAVRRDGPSNKLARWRYSSRRVCDTGHIYPLTVEAIAGTMQGCLR